MEKSLQVPTREEWQLGADAAAPRHEVPTPAPPPPDPSHARLERPLQVVTVEHLAWLLIGAWTLLTRLIALGARPLTPAEARQALFAFDLINRTNEAGAAGFHPSWSGWLDLISAGIFALCGASDIAARAIFVACGLLLVALAFALRPYVGRAGAIGAGAMLALSPTVTWFSRSATTTLAAVTLGLLTVVLFMALKARPSVGRAAALGVAGGLMVSASPIGLFIAVIFSVAMIILGLFAILVTIDRWLRIRVWFTRYSGMAVITFVIGIAVGVVSGMASESSLDGIKQVLASFLPLRASNSWTAFDVLILPLTFYEFLILLAAAAGFLTVLTARARSGFAGFTTLWTALSLMLYLATSVHTPEQILMIIVPAALLGGFAIEYLNRTWSWPLIRRLIGVLGLATIYVQLLTNFVNYAPDPSDAPWARHASLYWGEGATTPQTAMQCAAILKAIAPAGRTVFHAGVWPPALRWYLRDARPVIAADAATLVVETAPAARPNPGSAATVGFDYEESWVPSLAGLNTTRALLYFLSQRAWGEVTTRSVALQTFTRAGSASPAVVPPPHP